MAGNRPARRGNGQKKKPRASSTEGESLTALRKRERSLRRLIERLEGIREEQAADPNFRVKERLKAEREAPNRRARRDEEFNGPVRGGTNNMPNRADLTTAELLTLKKRELREVQRMSFKRKAKVKSGASQAQLAKAAKLRFFEQKKLERRLKQLDKGSGVDGDSGGVAGQEGEDAAASRARLVADLEYVRHFPSDRAYLPLFPQTPLSEENAAEQARIREFVRARVSGAGSSQSGTQQAPPAAARGGGRSDAGSSSSSSESDADDALGADPQLHSDSDDGMVDQQVEARRKRSGTANIEDDPFFLADDAADVDPEEEEADRRRQNWHRERKQSSSGFGKRSKSDGRRTGRDQRPTKRRRS